MEENSEGEWDWEDDGWFSLLPGASREQKKEREFKWRRREGDQGLMARCLAMVQRTAQLKWAWASRLAWPSCPRPVGRTRRNGSCAKACDLP